MSGRVRSTALTVFAAGLVGAVAVAASTGSRAPADTRDGAITAPSSIRVAAQQLLDARSSLMGNATRIALGMTARGDQLLKPGTPTHTDSVAASRPRGTSAWKSAGAMSDAGSAGAVPANVRVNNP